MNKEQYSYGVAVDPEGSIVVAGVFNKHIDFGPCQSSILAPGMPENGALFIVKLSPGGACIWQRTFLINVQTASVAVDGAGNVLAGGIALGTFNLQQNVTPWEPSVPTYSVFVLELDHDGEYVWSKRILSSQLDSFVDGADKLGQWVTVDPAVPGANVFVTGAIGLPGELSMTDPSSGKTELPMVPAAGDRDIFVLELDQNGNYVWGTGFGAPAATFNLFSAAVSAGKLFLTGNFASTKAAKVDVGSCSLDSPMDHDIFVAGLDADGGCEWARRFGGEHYDRGQDIVVTDAGEVLVSGIVTQNVDFGQGCFSTPVSADGTDPFLLKLDANHAYSWVQRFDGGVEPNDIYTSIAKTGEGAVVFAGLWRDDSPDKHHNSLHLKRIDAAGALVCEETFSVEVDLTHSGFRPHLAAAGKDAIVTGTFTSILDFMFPGGPLQTSGSADHDVFVARFAAPPP